MLAVLSTLSGTIATKQYFSNTAGNVKVWSYFIPLGFYIVFVLWKKWTTLNRVCKTFLSGGSSVPPRLTDLVKLAQECCYHSNLAVAAHGVIILSNIAISCSEKG